MSHAPSSSNPSDCNDHPDNVSAASNGSHTSSKKGHSHRSVGTLLSRTKNRFRKSLGSHELGEDVDIGALDRRLRGHSLLVGLEVSVSGSSGGGDEIELQDDEIGGNRFLVQVEDGDVVESAQICNDDNGAQEYGKSEKGTKERVEENRGDHRTSVETASTSELSLAPLTSLDRNSSAPVPQSPHSLLSTALKRSSSTPVGRRKSSMSVRTIDESLRGRATTTSELSQSCEAATLAPPTSLYRNSSAPVPQSTHSLLSTALKRSSSAPVRRRKSSMSVRTIEESLGGRATSHSGRVPKSVAFSTLEIREYPRAVGDNPSVLSGPPLAIDWWPDELEPHNDDSQSFDSAEPSKRDWTLPKSSVLQLDSYESHRPPRRSQDELMVPPQVRTMWLMNWGHSRMELNNAAQKVAKDRARREKTNQGLKFCKVHEAGESMGRMFKRMVGRKGNNRALYEEWKKKANDANAIDEANKGDWRHRSSLPPSFLRGHNTAMERGEERKRSGSLPPSLVNVGDVAIGSNERNVIGSMSCTSTQVVAPVVDIRKGRESEVATAGAAVD